MTLALWSPVQVLDGSLRARQNAAQALRNTITKREQERLAVARFERDYAARPRGGELAEIRRSAGLG
jgi:hypothetical protein